MAKKNLGTATTVPTMQKSNTIIIEIGGSIRRIALSDFIKAINEGDTELLYSTAWGVPIKQNQSSPAWGRVGNLNLWEEYKSRSGRYLVTNTGKAAKLSATNSAIYADGTALDETKGHIMTVFQDLYYTVKVDAQTNVPYLWMSMIPIGGHVIKRPCIGAYKGSMSGSALVSRSGVAPDGNKTITAFWNAAQVNGKAWGLADYDHRRFMMMLCLSEYGNPNVQAVLGNGVTGSGNGSFDSVSSAMKTGATKSLGDEFGAIDLAWTNATGAAVNGASRVSLLGIEDPYGWQWEMVQGVYCGKSANSAQDGTEIFVYEGNRMPSSAELASHPNGQYRQLSRLNAEGYIKTEILGEHFDLFPTAVGGGSTSYWCDYFYRNMEGGQLVLWGGAAHDGSYCGLAYAYSNRAFSPSSASIGARLAYYGDMEFVDGADI